MKPGPLRHRRRLRVECGVGHWDTLNDNRSQRSATPDGIQFGGALAQIIAIGAGRRPKNSKSASRDDKFDGKKQSGYLFDVALRPAIPLMEVPLLHGPGALDTVGADALVTWQDHCRHWDTEHLSRPSAAAVDRGSQE